MAIDVSVVVPCFNAGSYIADTLRGVLDQDLDDAASDIELIVVDDGSTDGSAAVVERMAARDRRVRLIRKVNGGVATARNVGFSACASSTRFVMFLDADDVPVAGSLSKMRRSLENDATLVAAFGMRGVIDATGTHISQGQEAFTVRHASPRSIDLVSQPHRIGYWNIVPINPITTPGQVLIRRNLLEENPFDPSTVPCEDWDLWLRLSRLGNFGVVPEVVLMYRDHVGGQSKQYSLMTRQRARVFRNQIGILAPEELARLRVACRFGMYRFDLELHCLWARQQLARHDLKSATRNVVRAAKYGVRYLVAVLAGRPELN
jgi:glycosyltransferase involved in cell wall biosynthesis